MNGRALESNTGSLNFPCKQNNNHSRANINGYRNQKSVLCDDETATKENKAEVNNGSDLLKLVSVNSSEFN